MASLQRLRDTDRLNLERANVLLVDDNAQALDILASILVGFGVKAPARCASAREAIDLLKAAQFDLVITDANMPDMDGWQLVQWIRGPEDRMNRYVPILVCTGYTPMAKVLQSRDCGANFIVVKPITPRTVLERIFWAATSERLFVEADSYCGPDRRFKREGIPVGTKGRRREDLSGHIGAAIDPNLSDEEIAAMVRPMKVEI